MVSVWMMKMENFSLLQKGSLLFLAELITFDVNQGMTSNDWVQPLMVAGLGTKSSGICLLVHPNGKTSVTIHQIRASCNLLETLKLTVNLYYFDSAMVF